MFVTGTSSVLILFYAREEKADDKASGTPRSLLALPRASSFFSSEESLYEGFQDTGIDIAQEIEEEINTEDDLQSVPIDTEIEEKNTQVQDQSSTNDESNANSIEAKPIGEPTTKILPECHFYASGEVDEDVDEELPEEVSLEEDDSETDLDDVRSLNKIGTGNVSMDNDMIERAIHKMQLLNSGLNVPETRFRDAKSKQAVSAKHNDQIKDKLNYNINVSDTAPTEVKLKLEVADDSKLTYEKQKQSSSPIDNAPRTDKFTNQSEPPDSVSVNLSRESEVPDEKEKQASSIVDNTQRKDKFSNKRESTDIDLRVSNESEGLDPRLTREPEKQSSSYVDNAPGKDKFANRRESEDSVSIKVSNETEITDSRLRNNGPRKDKFSIRGESSTIISTKKSNESTKSTHTDKTYEVVNEMQSLPDVRIVASSAGKQSVANEELKSRICFTVMKSLEQIKKHKARSDCTFNIYVRSAKPDSEPRQIQVRATSHQVKDGAARVFVKSLGNVADPVSHFDPFNQRNKKTRRHVNKNSSLVLADEPPAAKWAQKQGTCIYFVACFKSIYSNR